MEVYFFLTANKANRLKVILSKETKVTQSNLNDVPFLKLSKRSIFNFPCFISLFPKKYFTYAFFIPESKR